MKLPRRALVVGLARSGQSAALALARRGVPTIAVDRAAEIDGGRLAEAGVEVHAGTEEERLSYLFSLRNVKEGWMLEDRRAYFQFLRQAEGIQAGYSLPVSITFFDDRSTRRDLRDAVAEVRR